MSPSETIGTLDHLSVIVPAAIGILIAYRAWTLRRALVDPVYKSRALWTGIAGLGVLGLILSLLGDSLAGVGYGALANPTVALLVADTSWGLTFLALYGWIYTDINVAISSDFLHRDPLLWERGGKTVMLVTLVGVYALASLPPLPPIQALSALIASLIVVLFIVATGYAGLVLAISVRRIQNRLIKNYTKWVGICVFGFVVAIVLTSPGYLSPMIIPAYAMYRATGSLSIRTHEIPSS